MPDEDKYLERRSKHDDAKTRAELFSYITPNEDPTVDLFHEDCNVDLGKPVNVEKVLGAAWAALDKAESAGDESKEAVKAAEEEVADAEREVDKLKARVEALESSLTDLASYAAYAAEEMSKEKPDGDLATIGEQLASQVKTSLAVRDDGKPAKRSKKNKPK